MSMISELVKELRRAENPCGMVGVGYYRTLYARAADTIEELSAKLATSNMERSTAYYRDGWIPCSERLPVYYDWHYVTVKPFYEGKKNYVAMERFDSRKGEWSSHERAYKDKVIAWMPLPEPFKGEQND